VTVSFPAHHGYNQGVLVITNKTISFLWLTMRYKKNVILVTTFLMLTAITKILAHITTITLKIMNYFQILINILLLITGETNLN